ncbi:MAG: hypothetical protein ACFFAO_06440 [Candidatus Hermodarchaeota archaeon]
MATVKEITTQLKEFLKNGKNFECMEIPNSNGIVIQKLAGKSNQQPKLCEWIHQNNGKGTRIFDSDKFESLKDDFNNPNTLKVMKIIEKINPKDNGNSNHSDMKKLAME